MNLSSLTTSQQIVFDQLCEFIQSADKNVFILRGYAGTGKTYLMQVLAQHLIKEKLPYSFMATTGRAAAVLKGKTGVPTCTVHRALYTFKDVEDNDLDPKNEYRESMVLNFDLVINEKNKSICIIDEASMMSSTENEVQFAKFGTGRLLFDLFLAWPNCKLIFVGDPCQLPPVGEEFSPCLSRNFIEKCGKNVASAELREIIRIKEDNDILLLATYLRELIFKPVTVFPYWVHLPVSQLNNVTKHDNESILLNTYFDSLQNKGAAQTIAIANTNAKCYEINKWVRKKKYNQDYAPLQIGDLLLVTQNNYIVELVNGDFVEVSHIGNPISHCNLNFREVRVKKVNSDEEYAILLLEDILTRNVTNITAKEHQSLMIAFTQKMNEQGFKKNSEQYKQAMLKDAYLNALKAVYGYAVTCHKAQGGEWDEVFLFLSKNMFKTSDPERKFLLKFWYTAVTRTKVQLHLHNDWWIK